MSIYGFAGAERRLDQLRLLHEIAVPNPLRLAYDRTSNTVAVVSYGPNVAVNSHNFFSFDADSYLPLASTLLSSSQRGRINSQGLAAANGVFVTAGFDNQTVVIIDPKSLKVKAEILMPRCSLPARFSHPTPMTAAEATKQHQAGSNNWSGGICSGTLRNSDDRRFAVLDGFSWSPQDLEPS